MTTKQLNFKSLPQLAVIDGATSPNLGVSAKGSIVYSTTLGKALMWDGTKWSSAGLKGDTGASGATASVATTSANGLMSSVDKTKLDGIVTANLLSRANHTGTQAISTIDTLQSTLDTKASTGHSHTEATVSAKGFMSSADKAKLDGIVTANLLDRANHTGTQAISTITGLQTAIDGRASSGHSHSEATTSAGGFMSSADKIKLNSLNSVDLLNRVNHTGEQAIATVTGLQAALNTKAATTHSHSDVTTTSNGFMTAADKIKLDGIVTANLLNRANHTGEQAIATVTGLQTALNGKASTTHTHADATTTVAGFMSFADKTKLDGIVTANLVSRANHTGEQAISSVTGLQAALDTKASTGHSHSDATTTTNGFMSSADKVKLNGLNSVDLLNRANHTGAQAISSVTDLQAALDTKASTAHTHANATTAVAGFMSSTDKIKLDGVSTGATAYVHPANHPASIITQDASNRFVTDAEKTAWNAKIGSVKTINGQSIVGSGDLVVAGSSTFATDITVNNITVGRGAGNSSENTAIGFEALSSNTTGVKNTAIGQGALRSNIIGTDNAAFGTLALANLVEGYGNVAIGAYALKSHGDGVYNVAIGYNALTNHPGYDGINTAIGANALSSATGNGTNTAIGNDSLRSAIAGTGNTAVGDGSLIGTIYGSYNCGFGVASLGGNTNGNNNTAIGEYALGSNTTGNYNIGIGSRGGPYVSTGSNNICIGSISSLNNHTFNVTTESNRVVMGNAAVTNAYIQVAWTVVSDARDKTNFAPVPHGLDFVKKLKPVAYQFKVSREDNTPHGGVKYGFKAQDILELEGDSPVIIDNETPDKLKFVDQHLIAVMVKAIQELTAKVERLENANINT
jgi:hypothetical protein